MYLEILIKHGRFLSTTCFSKSECMYVLYVYLCIHKHWLILCFICFRETSPLVQEVCFIMPSGQRIASRQERICHLKCIYIESSDIKTDLSDLQKLYICVWFHCCNSIYCSPIIKLEFMITYPKKTVIWKCVEKLNKTFIYTYIYIYIYTYIYLRSDN